MEEADQSDRSKMSLKEHLMFNILKARRFKVNNILGYNYIANLDTPDQSDDW